MMNEIEYAPPIALDSEEVRAVQKRTKTMKRLPVKGYALEHLQIDTDGTVIGVYDQTEGCVRPVLDFAPYRAGDVLWVRETWCNVSKPQYEPEYYYLADAELAEDYVPREWRWRSSTCMPKVAARIWLRVTNVRAERLQDITEDNAIKEGIVGTYPPSRRDADKKSKWLSGHCSECIHFDLFKRLAMDACPGDYKDQKPRHDWGSSVGCMSAFRLQSDKFKEPPIFQFAEVWDRNELRRVSRSKSTGCYFWHQNPWVWVFEFRLCEKPEGWPT